jgi:hypothetical protein
MIYCGSGSYFGKVLVQVPVPVLALDPNLFRTGFQQQKICKKFTFSILKAALFQES